MSRVLLLWLVVLPGCTRTAPPARAYQLATRAETVGGPRALGDVEPAVENVTELLGGPRATGQQGDFKLTNGIVHAIVQNVGTSRGFGAFGGSLVDVDLVRGARSSAAVGVLGNDYFTEMFPAFFLSAVEPHRVEVLEDGASGGRATIRVTGRASNFLSLVRPLTELLDPRVPLTYTCDYSLEPGEQYLTITVTVRNESSEAVPGWGADVPFGFITLLGEGQRLFVPGQAGFDMRYHLEDVVYRRPASLAALPGEVAPMWATEGAGVSYALVPGRQPGGSYLEQPVRASSYPSAGPDSMLIPLASSSFLAALWAPAPAVLPAGGTYRYTAFLVVGSGDVASVQAVINRMREVEVTPEGRERVLREPVPFGTIAGVVRETPTQVPVQGVSVVAENEAGEVLAQALTVRGGAYRLEVPPGRYRVHAVDGTRDIGTSPGILDVPEGAQVRADVALPQAGELRVLVRDELGRAIPAKITVEAVADNPVADRLPRRFLYRLKLGDRYRVSDLDPDRPEDPATRRYVERILLARTGSAGGSLRPGRYRVHASRGMEYGVASEEVDLRAGTTAEVRLTVPRVLATPGWVSADFHVHSASSVDSDVSLPDRVVSYAAEGVDVLTSTDHNVVTDLGPTAEALGLLDWVRPVVGLELTTLEAGHFNAYPLALQPGPIQHGSFRWFFRPPGELFAQLRALGTDPARTVVQINHPRDTILGYFNAYNLNTYTGRPGPAGSGFGPDTTPLPDGGLSPYDPRNYSSDFDVIEVFNGKRFDIMNSYRRPVEPLPGPEPLLPPCPPGGATTRTCLPAPGELLEQVAASPDGGPPIVTPAFPGAQDDWFTLLGRGERKVAVGNSDSHSEKDEPGSPRTYVQVGRSADGSMRALDQDALVDGLLAGRVVVTNGPWLEVTVNGLGPGATVIAGDGTIDVHVRVEAAPWVDVRRVRILRGGRDQGRGPHVLDTIEVPASEAVVRLDVRRTYTGIPDGSYVVVEAAGDRPMWPVVTPQEAAPLLLDTSFAALTGGLFTSPFGKYQPSLQQQAPPYAFTNPVWIDRALRQPLTAPRRVLGPSTEPFVPRVLPDLTKLFHAFHGEP